MYFIIKPILDILSAIIALVLLSPIFIILSVVLLFSNKGTPYFFQNRAGKNERIFKIIKFKTMTNKKDIHGELLPDNERLTTIGSFVRKASLDELPQLINVLMGDMSIIGPRPFLSEYLSIYDDYQKRRLEVKPGITGWAQINGRNDLSFNQKIEYDVWYVNNVGFFLDVKIFFLTLVKIFKSLDANQVGEVTNIKFNGKN